MKRRTFLQSIGAGIAALFVPAAAAEKLGFMHGARPSTKILREAFDARNTIYPGDICVWDNGAYRPANHPEDYRNSRMAIAVPDGSGGFTFARYPECMDVVIDIEIRG